MDIVGEMPLAPVDTWDRRLCSLVRPSPSYVRPITISKWPSSDHHPEKVYIRLRVGSDHTLITLDNAKGLVEELKRAVAVAQGLNDSNS